MTGSQHVGTTLIQKTSGRIAAVTLVTFLLVGCLSGAIAQLSALFALTDIGYGDSYILYDVLHFEKSGVIYRDLSLPPYLPAQYSPLVYRLYSFPDRISTFPNLFFGSRLMALTAFLICLAIVISITQALIPERSAWMWALLLAASIGAMRDWVLQLRGDFPAIVFDLFAIRLLLARSRWAVLLAGLCAGFATQFKFTYVAALIAGSLWLLARRRWKDLGRFAAAGLLSSLGIYLFFWTREHRMLQQMMALSPGIAEFDGLFKMLYHLAKEPVFLLAVLAISPVALQAGPRWGLLMLFGLVSFSIAALTDIQAGGNVNYFFEALFAIVPASVLGVHRLLALAKQHVGAGLFVTALLFLLALFPAATDLYYGEGSRTSEMVTAKNLEFRKFEGALHGQHIFSTVPRVALLDAEPALMEPYLLSYSQRLGKFDPAPILRRVGDREFDIVVTSSKPQSWRGIPHIEPDLRRAIMASYMPHCIYSEYLLHLPNDRQENSALKRALTEIGCIPISCNGRSVCPTW